MKKWYWVVGCDNATAQPFVADEADLGEYEDKLSVCQFVQHWPGTAWVRASSSEQDGDPDDALQTCIPVPIFSPRLRAAVEQSGIRGIQYLPIRVIRPGGELISGFTVANVVNCVDALDLALSTVKHFPEDYFLATRRGKIRSLDIAVLVGKVIESYDIIRLCNYKSSLYVSDRFAKIFEAGHFTGLSFHEVATS